MNYFTTDELACPCCGKTNFSEAALKKFNWARQLSGIPFHVNSACRCWSHNKAVGGKPGSAHLIEDEDGQPIECTAIDIKCDNSSDRAKIIKSLIVAGFNRIGIAKTFIHGDDSPTNSPNVFWVY